MKKVSQFCRNVIGVTYFQCVDAYYNTKCNKAEVLQVTVLFYLIVTVKCPSTRGTTSFDHLRRHLKHLWEAFSILSSELWGLRCTSANLDVCLWKFDVEIRSLPIWHLCKLETQQSAAGQTDGVPSCWTGHFLSPAPSLSVSLSLFFYADNIRTVLTGL